MAQPQSPPSNPGSGSRGKKLIGVERTEVGNVRLQDSEGGREGGEREREGERRRERGGGLTLFIDQYYYLQLAEATLAYLVTPYLGREGGRKNDREREREGER